MASPYIFRWRLLFIDGRVAEVTANDVKPMAGRTSFYDGAGLIMTLPTDILMGTWRVDQNHRAFPISDADLLAMYERVAKRPLPPVDEQISSSAERVLAFKPDAG